MGNSNSSANSTGTGIASVDSIVNQIQQPIDLVKEYRDLPLTQSADFRAACGAPHDADFARCFQLLKTSTPGVKFQSVNPNADLVAPDMQEMPPNDMISLVAGLSNYKVAVMQGTAGFNESGVQSAVGKFNLILDTMAAHARQHPALRRAVEDAAAAGSSFNITSATQEANSLNTAKKANALRRLPEIGQLCQEAVAGPSTFAGATQQNYALAKYLKLGYIEAVSDGAQPQQQPQQQQYQPAPQHPQQYQPQQQQQPRTPVAVRFPEQAVEAPIYSQPTSVLSSPTHRLFGERVQYERCTTSPPNAVQNPPPIRILPVEARRTTPLSPTPRGVSSPGGVRLLSPTTSANYASPGHRYM